MIPALDRTHGFGSPRLAFKGGARAAIGVPVLALGASYLGLGALVRESGLAVWYGLLSTATAWALPGQILLFELYALGATLLAIGLGVGLSAARLLPMTMTLLPWLRSPGRPRWRYFLAAHWIAVTGWAVTLQVAPKLPAEQRLPFFTGFTMTIWGASMACTAIGYMLPGALPERVSLALLFLNPIYFLVLFLGDLKQRPRRYALAFGFVLGPTLFLVEPDWSLLGAGLIGGSLAFWLARRETRREQGREPRP